jgi:hypothetical protein
MSDRLAAGHHLRFGNHAIRLPRSKFMRVLLGSALVLGGLLWFLPILGLWMLPLGITVLSIDFHALRRARRRFDAWWGRSRRGRPRETKKKGPGV